MVRSRIGRPRRLVAGVMLLGLAIGGACLGGRLGPEPEVATMLLLFPGNDTVFVDIGSGDITSGPIETFSDADFTAEFFADDGTPDSRVTEQRFRLDVTPANTGIVTFTRGSAFSGTLHKVATGSTQIAVALVNIAESRNLFLFNIPVNVN